MSPPSVQDLVKLNVFAGSLLIIFAVGAFWASIEWGALANPSNIKPEAVPDALFSQRMYDTLRDAAVACYKQQDELHVSMLRDKGKDSFDTSWILAVLSGLFFFNARSFRKLSQKHAGKLSSND